MKIKRVENKRGLTMGKKAVVLDTALTPEEKSYLQKQIKDFTTAMQKDIEEKYPDDYKRTIMMDDNTTQ
jgi:hypothetical protein